MSEFGAFLHAVRFMTVVPVPAAPHDPDWLARSAKYFSAVGALIGVAAAAVLHGASALAPPSVAALLALGVGVAITGALHEDGLADTADALGGGRDRAARLAIMKDSRLGTYGALALGFVLAAKAAVLANVPVLFGMAALVATASLGRFATVAAMAAIPYGGDPSTAKTSYPDRVVRPGTLAVGAIFAAAATAPLMVIAPWPAVVGVLAGAACVALLLVLARRRIGGWTGDVLGACEQAFGAAFLLAACMSLT